MNLSQPATWIILLGVIAVAAFVGAAWGHWVSRRHASWLVDALNVKIEMIESRTRTSEDARRALEERVDGHLKDLTKRLHNATATTRRIRGNRDRLREKLTQRATGSKTDVEYGAKEHAR